MHWQALIWQEVKDTTEWAADNDAWTEQDRMASSSSRQVVARADAGPRRSLFRKCRSKWSGTARQSQVEPHCTKSLAELPGSVELLQDSPRRSGPIEAPGRSVDLTLQHGWTDMVAAVLAKALERAQQQALQLQSKSTGTEDLILGSCSIPCQMSI